MKPLERFWNKDGRAVTMKKAMLPLQHKVLERFWGEDGKPRAPQQTPVVG